MRSLFAGITTRGRAFFAAGIAVGALGLSLGQRELVSLGGVLVFLPLLSALAAGRGRYRVPVSYTHLTLPTIYSV